METSPLPDAFYLREGDQLIATPMTRGPWDDRFQHGGPPAALVAGAMERFDGGAEFFVARIWIELLRPVPIAPLRLALAPVSSGRTVQRLEATLSAAGEGVLTARGLRIRRAHSAASPPLATDPWPDPDSLPDYTFTFFRGEVGYHRGVQLRLAHGAWGATPIGFWARPRIALVAGQPTSPLEQLMVLADAQSGMGVPLDPLRHSFPNPDLTVYLERALAPGWFGFDIRSTANAEGAGLARSVVRDARGVVGLSAQSLVVAGRA